MEKKNELGKRKDKTDHIETRDFLKESSFMYDATTRIAKAVEWPTGIQDGREQEATKSKERAWKNTISTEPRGISRTMEIALAQQAESAKRKNRPN